MTKNEINRAVAEKVMVWTTFGGFYFDINENKTDIRIMDWNPAERIDHAWMVVEKLVEKGYHIELTINKDGACCDICADDGQRVSVLYRHGADTAPLAISLVALEAVKEE